MFYCWLQWCGQVNFRTLLAQFGLTPKSKRGLAASDPVADWRRINHLR
jgi:hypothetical protein